jgi:hypothetical protein
MTWREVRMRFRFAAGRVSLSVLLAAALGQGPALSQEGPARARRAGDKTEGEEEQIRLREEWFRLSHGLEKVARPDLLRAGAVAELARVQRLRAPELERAGETWSSLGPVTMTMLSWTMGRVSGRVAALAVSPASENTLYLGAASGGVWRTTNGGTSWTPVFDAAGTLTIGALLVDPASANTVWVGTGERQSSCARYFGLGLFRSTDGGATFQARNGAGTTALQLSYVTSIARHPTSASTLLVSGEGFCQADGSKTTGGVYRSSDSGATWTRVLGGTGSDVIYHPTTPNVVYAAMSNDGVYKSNDGGVTWALASSGMVTGSAIGRLRLALAPSSTQRLYALSSSSRLYRTLDGAATWTLRNSAACEGQCTYNLTLDVLPTNSSTVLVGTIRFARSTDGGTTLTPLTTTWGSGQKVHQDTHVVRYSRSNASRFWVGSDGGLWRTDDGGTNFVNLNTNVNLTQFYDIAIDPADPNRVFGGAQDNSSLRRNGSQQWAVTRVTGDGFLNLVDPGSSNRVFQTSYPSSGVPRLILSTTGGEPNTFSNVATTGITAGEPFPFVTPIAIVSGTVFVGSNALYRGSSSQAPASFAWTKISGNLTGDTTSISVINPLIAGGSVLTYVGTSNGRIQRTANALAAAPVWTNVTGNYPGGFVSDIAVDPTNTQRVFATRGAFGQSRLYRSTTGGTTWTAVGSGLPNVPANTVAIDPLEPARVFVGTDVGVYESGDGGNTFVPFSLGLPLGLVVMDLEVDDSPHVLVAGTYGRGAYRVNLTP